MRKRVTHKQAYKAIKKIIRYCKQTPKMCNCNCIFYDEDRPTNSCALAKSNPESWDKSRTKSVIENNLAEVLKCET